MIALQFGSGRNPFEAIMYDYLKLESLKKTAKALPSPTDPNVLMEQIKKAGT